MARTTLAVQAVAWCAVAACAWAQVTTMALGRGGGAVRVVGVSDSRGAVARSLDAFAVPSADGEAHTTVLASLGASLRRGSEAWEEVAETAVGGWGEEVCVGGGCGASGDGVRAVSIQEVGELRTAREPVTVVASVEDGSLEGVLRALGAGRDGAVPPNVQLFLRVLDQPLQPQHRRLADVDPSVVTYTGIQAIPVGIQGLAVIFVLLGASLLMINCLFGVQGPSQFNTKALPPGRRDFG